MSRASLYGKGRKKKRKSLLNDGEVEADVVSNLGASAGSIDCRDNKTGVCLLSCFNGNNVVPVSVVCTAVEGIGNHNIRKGDWFAKRNPIGCARPPTDAFYTGDVTACRFRGYAQVSRTDNTMGPDFGHGIDLVL